MMLNRLAVYAGTSTVLAAGVVLRAFHQRANFYSAAVSLAQSNASLMVLTNLVLLILCGVMVGLQRLLYGPLRPIEIEQLYEKAWFAITETCLAMTIFRDEVGGWFLVMFIALLVGKVWGWIGEGRVEVLEQQPPANPSLFHARLSFSLFLSLVLDLALLRYAVRTVLQMARPNMIVMFAFEFAVLTISSSSTTARYVISLIEAYIIQQQTRAKLQARRAELRAARSASDATPAAGEDELDEMDVDVPGWEDKGQWIVGLDLVTDCLKLIVYLAFFSILLSFYGLPIHIMRDVFLTLRSFIKRITDFLRYRRATKDMNERYPDASAEEIARGEVCIICREEMQAWAAEGAQAGAQDGADGAGAAAARPRTRTDERSRPKKLPCGHILHFGCLRSWLERQQICPTCRRSVMVPVRRTGAAANPAARAGVPAANAALANGRAVRPGGVDAAGAAGAGAAGRPVVNRGRVINFGPFRVGFGIGQNDMLQNLAQQLQEGQAGPVPAAARDRGATGHGRPQLGVGIGVGRAAAGPAATAASQPSEASPADGSAPLPMNVLVQQMEHQIALEINNLRATADQLRLIHALQAELSRIRQSQDSQSGGAARLAPQQAWAPYPPRAPLVPGQSFLAGAQQWPMAAGHPDLPPNMVLPPGWTVLPLTRVGGVANGPTNFVPPTGPAVTGAGGSTHAAPSTGRSSHATSSQTASTGSSGTRPASAAGSSMPRGDGSIPTTSSRIGSEVWSGAEVERSSEGGPSAGSASTATTALRPTPPPTTTTTTTTTTTANTMAVPAWGERSDEGQAGTKQAESTRPDGADQVAGSGSSQGIGRQRASQAGPDKGKAKAATVEDIQDESDA